ncbi:MAG: zinc-dependent alcohol dehydrogenase [Chloroflexota bacterium]
MKAWRFYALGEMRLDDIPYPAPKPGWVTLKTRVVQPSVTEAIRAKGGPTAGADYIRKVIQEKAPVQLFGHEFTAEVVELGEGVTSLKVGERVSGRSRMPCHQCELCRAGFEDRCRKGPVIGQQIPGALCEYLALPAEALAVLPPEVSDGEGACMQPLAGCMSDISDAGIRPGDTVAITGQGVMGLNILQLARISGAGRVIGIDIKKSNLRLSKELGSSYQVDASEVDPVEAVRELTHGFGPDIVFECAGGSPGEGLAGTRTLNQAMQMVTDAGKVVQVAMFGGRIEIDADLLRKKSISYIFPKAPTAAQMDHAVNVVADGRVKVSSLITHVLYGIEKVQESFEITANKGKYDAVNPAQVVVSQ